MFQLHHLDRSLNKVVIIDHMFMGRATLQHVKDVATPVSAAYVVTSNAFDEAIIGFESCVPAPVWPPSSIQSD